MTREIDTSGSGSAPAPHSAELRWIITVVQALGEHSANGHKGKQLGHTGSPVSPFTMLEKVAECRDTNTLSCSSRLQMPGSMSQDLRPSGGRGVELRWENQTPPLNLPLHFDHLCHFLPSSTCPGPTTGLTAPAHYQTHSYLWALAPAAPTVCRPPLPFASCCAIQTPCKLKTGCLLTHLGSTPPSTPPHTLLAL